MHSASGIWMQLRTYRQSRDDHIYWLIGYKIFLGMEPCSHTFGVRELH